MANATEDLSGNESYYNIDDLEWQSSENMQSRLDWFLFFAFPPAIIVGVVGNGLFAAVLAKPRVIQQYQFCVYLLAVSISNIFELIFIYGLHWIFLLDVAHFINTTGGYLSCKISYFFWTLFHSSLSVLMVGILVNRLLALQLTDDLGSTTSPDSSSCCRLPRNPFWKKVATRFCSPIASFVFVGCAALILILTSLPNFWFYSTHDGYCNIVEHLYYVVFKWYAINLSTFGFIFFMTFSITVPMIVCGSGSKPVSSFHQMFGYSELDANEEDPERNFTRLALVTSSFIWVTSLPLNILRLLGYIIFFDIHRVMMMMHFFINVIRAIQCAILVAWPFLCLVLVPMLRTEVKVTWSLVKDLSDRTWFQCKRCCRQTGSGIVVHTASVYDMS